MAYHRYYVNDEAEFESYAPSTSSRNLSLASPLQLKSVHSTVRSIADSNSDALLIPLGPSKPSTGKPAAKPVLDVLDVLALALSLVCFGAAVVVITPRLSIAHMLGYNGQLIVIGVILSAQSLCLKRVLPTVLAQIEDRIGQSALQNYNAIITNSIFANETAFTWRAVILAIILLPVGLSTAYKQFPGGSASALVPSPGHFYGLTAPASLSTLGFHSGQSIMVNATIPFTLAYQNLVSSSPPPTTLKSNEAYGFNTLLIANGSTALLDAPFPEVVADIQGALAFDEVMQISADVQATVTRYNDTLEQHRDTSDPFWNDTYWGQGGEYLYGNHCWNGWVIGFKSAMNVSDNSWVMMGILPSYSDFTVPLVDPYSPLYFVQVANMFTTRREMCSGTWNIKQTSIELVSGHCQGGALPDTEQQLITNSRMNFQNFYMSLTQEFLCPYTPPTANTSAWTVSAMSTFVATMTWSRLIGSNEEGSKTRYFVNDVLLSTKTTMRPEISLFAVPAVLPALTLLLLIVGVFCYASPVGKGFGLPAILAGVDAASLAGLHGGGFSGAFDRRVRLRLDVELSARGNARVVHRVNDPAPNGSILRQQVLR